MSSEPQVDGAAKRVSPKRLLPVLVLLIGLGLFFALYDLERVPLYEELWGTEAHWIDLSTPPDMPLYPDGLIDLLRATAQHQL